MAEMDLNDFSEAVVSSKRPRKRKLNPENWKKNVEKRNGTVGKEEPTCSLLPCCFQQTQSCLPGGRHFAGNCSDKTCG